VCDSLGCLLRGGCCLLRVVCGVVAAAVDEQRLWRLASQAEGQGHTICLGLQGLEQPVEHRHTPYRHFTCTTNTIIMIALAVALRRAPHALLLVAVLIAPQRNPSTRSSTGLDKLLV
jgi:adenylosuccinate lyase